MNYYYSDEAANASGNDIINKECSPIRNKKNCVSNTKCRWDDKNNFCTRDSRTVETAELEALMSKRLDEAPSTPPPHTGQIPKPSSNSLFIVKRILPTDQAILNLPQTHFLKKRRDQPYTEFRRFNDTLGLDDNHNARYQLRRRGSVAVEQHNGSN